MCLWVNRGEKEIEYESGSCRAAVSCVGRDKSSHESEDKRISSFSIYRLALRVRCVLNSEWAWWEIRVRNHGAVLKCKRVRANWLFDGYCFLNRYPIQSTMFNTVPFLEMYLHVTRRQYPFRDSEQEYLPSDSSSSFHIACSYRERCNVPQPHHPYHVNKTRAKNMWGLFLFIWLFRVN